MIENKKGTIKCHFEYILQIAIIALLVLVDNVRNVGFLGEWKNGFIPEGIGVFVFGTIVLHYGLEKCKKIWIYIWSFLCIVLLVTCKFFFYYFPGLYYGECLFLILNIYLGVIAFWLIIQNDTDRSCFKRIFFPERKKDIIKILLGASWLLFYLLAAVGVYRNDMPLYLLIIFGVFYFYPIRKNEMIKLLSELGTGMTMGFWILQIFAFGFRPYDKESPILKASADYSVQYNGPYYNSNVYAMLCITIVLISLFKIFEAAEKEKKIAYWLWLINLALAYDFILLTIGRTAIAIATFGLIVTVLFRQLVFDKARILKTFFKILLGVAVIIFCFPIAYCSARFLPTALKHPVWYVDEYFDDGSVQAGASWNDKNYVSFKEYLNAVVGRAKNTVDNNNFYLEITEEEIEMDPDADTGKYFLGESYNSFEYRFGIAMTYLDRVNIRGHRAGEQVLWVSPYEQMVHSHNLIVQMFYNYGLPAGIAFCIWMLLYLVQSVRFFVKNNKKWYGLLPLAVFLFFAGYGMIECVWEIGQITLTILLVMQKPLLQGGEQESNI